MTWELFLLLWVVIGVVGWVIIMIRWPNGKWDEALFLMLPCCMIAGPIAFVMAAF